MTDCIFCKIVAGEAPAQIVYETETVVVFQDISPVAPVHVLVVPRQHISGIDALDGDNAALMADLVQAARAAAAQLGIAGGGYRLVINQGQNGGQSVFHLHLHLMGGRQMTWPAG